MRFPMPFAFHPPGYNYLGPGTWDFTRIPTGELDRAAREHDQGYTRPVYKDGKRVNPYLYFNKADQEFLNRIEHISGPAAASARSIFGLKKRVAPTADFDRDALDAYYDKLRSQFREKHFERSEPSKRKTFSSTESRKRPADTFAFSASKSARTEPSKPPRTWYTRMPYYRKPYRARYNRRRFKRVFGKRKYRRVVKDMLYKCQSLARFHDTQIYRNVLTVPTTADAFLLNDISKGTSQNNREGDWVNMTAIYLHMLVSGKRETATETNGWHVRICIVYDKQTNKVATPPKMSDVYGYGITPTSHIFAFRNIDNTPRFKVIYDKVLFFNWQTQTSDGNFANVDRQIKKVIKFKKPLGAHFYQTSGTGAENLTRGALWLMANSASAGTASPANHVEVSGIARLKFVA